MEKEEVSPKQRPPSSLSSPSSSGVEQRESSSSSERVTLKASCCLLNLLVVYTETCQCRLKVSWRPAEGQLKADGSDESFHYLQWVLSAARPRRCLFFMGKRSLVHTQWSHCDVISSQCLWETSLNTWVTCRCELRCFYVNRQLPVKSLWGKRYSCVCDKAPPPHKSPAVIPAVRTGLSVIWWTPLSH